MKKKYNSPTIKAVEIRPISLLTTSVRGITEDGYYINYDNNFEEAPIDDAS